MDEHVRLVLPDDPDMTKALICDAMSQDDGFLNAVCACVAGWFAFQPDEDWDAVKGEMDKIRRLVMRDAQCRAE